LHNLEFFVLDGLVVAIVAELDLGARGMEQRIPKVFIDPGGRHSVFTVCSSSTADTYYLHGKWRKPRMLSRLKGSTASCVAWNRGQINEGSAQLVRAKHAVSRSDGTYFQFHIQGFVLNLAVWIMQ
jgi:hypothetical protein